MSHAKRVNWTSGHQWEQTYPLPACFLSYRVNLAAPPIDGGTSCRLRPYWLAWVLRSA